MKRRCEDCGREFDGDGRNRQCRQCQKTYYREYQRQYQKIYRPKYVEKNKEFINSYNAWWMKKKRAEEWQDVKQE